MRPSAWISWMWKYDIGVTSPRERKLLLTWNVMNIGLCYVEIVESYDKTIFDLYIVKTVKASDGINNGFCKMYHDQWI